MTHPTPYPRCIFCGAKANSREHAIPKWIAKRLGIKEFLAGGHLGQQTRKQPISFASYRKHIFCKPCNGHFKHLEDDVVPLLEPMAKGWALGLDSDSQALLGLWAAKTAIALVAANNIEQTAPSRIEVPIDHRISVREDGRPSDSVWVGYVPWEGRPIVSLGEAFVVNPHSGAAELEVYVVVLGFAKVAFKVFGLITPLPLEVEIGGSGASVSQVWPTANRVLSWPAPGPPASGEALAALLNFVPLRPTPRGR